MAFPVSETKVREARLTGTAKSMWIVCRYLSTDRLTSVAASMCSLAVPLPSFGSIPLQLRAVTPIGSSQYLSCFATIGRFGPAFLYGEKEVFDRIETAGSTACQASDDPVVAIKKGRTGRASGCTSCRPTGYLPV